MREKRSDFSQLYIFLDFGPLAFYLFIIIIILTQLRIIIVKQLLNIIELTTTISTIYYDYFLHKNYSFERNSPPRISFIPRVRAAAMMVIRIWISIIGLLSCTVFINRRLCCISLYCQVFPQFYNKATL